MVRCSDRIFDDLIGRGFDTRDKAARARSHILYMLSRTQSMFRYRGLPDTIPARSLELLLQCNGYAGFYRHNGALYALRGGLGGVLDANYLPTLYTIANPYLHLDVTAEIGKNCVVIPNDTFYQGLYPLFARFADDLAEAEISLGIAAINSRIVSVIAAPDDRTKQAAEKYLSDVASGKLGVIGDNDFLGGVKVQPYGNAGTVSSMKTLIELVQYYRATWFNEIGLSANYNMKREALNSAESALNNDILLPLVDDMLSCRKRGIDAVNEMFGTSITVSLSSSWEDNAEEVELGLSGQSETEVYTDETNETAE